MLLTAPPVGGGDGGGAAAGGGGYTDWWNEGEVYGPQLLPLPPGDGPTYGPWAPPTTGGGGGVIFEPPGGSNPDWGKGPDPAWGDLFEKDQTPWWKK